MNPELLAQAAAWRLIGLLFERPKVGWVEEVGALDRESSDPALQEAARLGAAAAETQYLALMGPGGPASPREAGYRGRLDPGQLMADISGFYQAFAFEPRREDPIDHIAVEAGFAGFLFLKEALAPDREAAVTIRDARELFFAEHLGPLAAGLHRRLEQLGASPWQAVAKLAWEKSGCCAPPSAAPMDEEPASCEGLPRACAAS